MKRLLHFGLTVAIVLSIGSADAREDHNADGNRYSEKRCDTYYAPGHETGSNRANKSSEDHESEFDAGDVGGLGLVYVHNHTGHYAVRGDSFYLEVVGGGGNGREGNQGGWAQGEVDVLEGAPDVDFHSGAYAGTNGSNHSENGCVSVADNKIGESGQQEPGKYCLLDRQKDTCTFAAIENGLRVYSEFATGMKVRIERKVNGVWTDRVNQTLAGPHINKSLSYGSMQAGDRVTCTLLPDANGQIVGRMHCSA